MKDNIIKKLYVIFANYLLSEELTYAVNDVLKLPVTQADLPFLEKIFMKDVAPICRHLFMFYPYDFDDFFYTFTEEDISKYILEFKQSYFFRYFVKLSFFSIGENVYYTSWKTLEKDLLLKWNN